MSWDKLPKITDYDNRWPCEECALKEVDIEELKEKLEKAMKIAGLTEDDLT